MNSSTKTKNKGAAINTLHIDLCTCPTEKESELLSLGIDHYSDEI